MLHVRTEHLGQWPLSFRKKWKLWVHKFPTWEASRFQEEKNLPNHHLSFSSITWQALHRSTCEDLDCPHREYHVWMSVIGIWSHGWPGSFQKEISSLSSFFSLWCPESCAWEHVTLGAGCNGTTSCRGRWNDRSLVASTRKSVLVNYSRDSGRSWWETFGSIHQEADASACRRLHTQERSQWATLFTVYCFTRIT